MEQNIADGIVEDVIVRNGEESSKSCGVYVLQGIKGKEEESRRNTKHFCLCGETVSSSFFSFVFNYLKNVNITPQHHIILSFLLHFYPGHLQLSHLQCSVARSAFKDFCITRLGCLSELVDRRAKNCDRGLKAG